MNNVIPLRVSPLEAELNIDQDPVKKSESSSSSGDSEDEDTSKTDQKIKENSDEYWMALRKRANLS